MASDFGLSIQSDVPPGFQFTRRPWLDFYGVSIKPFIHFGSVASKPFSDPALIHRSLPDELLHEIIGAVENHRIFQSTYQGSWRKMWLLRPRIRTDGLYVSRNTYVRCGTPEWKTSNPVHVVCYFRYIRFFHSGRFLYKNSSQKVKDVVKFMNFRAPKADSVFGGRYTLSYDKVEVAIMYPGTLLLLRGTTVGANNRMDLLSLVTSGVNANELSGNEDNILGVVEGWQEDETHDPDVPAVSHRRGMTPFVFVPFEEVETTVLNLPVEKMDYFVTG
ncbi:hypothetical protein MKX01_035102 [Papaver californicum]|nr:hypothetical protein MKX01_035102 [Papaver californicum]